jgi:hypothetical protein
VSANFETTAMQPDPFRDDFFGMNILRMFFGGREFDWLTVVTLFLIGAFYAWPLMRQCELTGRSRACFITAIWLLVLKLLVHLVYMVIFNVWMFSMIDSPARAPGPGRPPGSREFWLILQLIFPVLEAIIYFLALVVFAIGVPGMIEPKEPWEPESANRSR